MDLGIKGKSAIVCAASKGLGRGCAEALAREGVDVTICARGADALNATARELGTYGVKVTPVACDVTTEAGRKALDHVFGSREVTGRHFVVAGLGQVGGRLARALAEGGARLTVTDVATQKRALADELGAEWVEPAEAHRVEADVFVPCGLGGVLTPEVVEQLRVRAVVGAANNQLAERDVARMLRQRGIVWAPDFVVNAGGVVYLDLAATPGIGQDELDRRIAGIGDVVGAVLRDADQAGITTLDAAERLAQARLDAAR